MNCASGIPNVQPMRDYEIRWTEVRARMIARGLLLAGFAEVLECQSACDTSTIRQADV
ncbi:MAG: hypothetical protein ABFD60_05175 [Bryobacteraceae bacterium]